jgi:2-methylisocitrate lyase-like PEP mutase family enzyme
VVCCGRLQLTELADIAMLARRIQLPLNVLWQPGTTLAQLGEAGVARVSTGSALYRRALAAGVAAAVAAQQDRPPHGSDLRYDGVLYALRRSAARVS